MDFDKAEDVILVISVHESEVGTLGTSAAENGVTQCDDLMMPFIVAFAGHCHRRFHG